MNLLLFLVLCFSAWAVSPSNDEQMVLNQPVDHHGNSPKLVEVLNTQSLGVRTRLTDGIYSVHYDTTDVANGDTFKFKSIRATNSYGQDQYLSGGHGAHLDSLHSHLDCPSHTNGGLCRIFMIELVDGEPRQAVKYGDRIKLRANRALRTDKNQHRYITVTGDHAFLDLPSSDPSSMMFEIISPDPEKIGNYVQTKDQIELKSVASGLLLQAGMGDGSEVQLGLDPKVMSFVSDAKTIKSEQYATLFEIEHALPTVEMFEQPTLFLFHHSNGHGKNEKFMANPTEADEMVSKTQLHSLSLCQLWGWKVDLCEANFKNCAVRLSVPSGACHQYTQDTAFETIKTYPPGTHVPKGGHSQQNVEVGMYYLKETSL